MNGQIAYERKCKNGLLDGKSTSYHYNGKIGCEGQYKNGKQDGTWKWYNFYTGLVYEEADYKDGIRTIRRCYDDNGVRKECN